MAVSSLLSLLYPAPRSRSRAAWRTFDVHHASAVPTASGYPLCSFSNCQLPIHACFEVLGQQLWYQESLPVQISGLLVPENHRVVRKIFIN